MEGSRVARTVELARRHAARRQPERGLTSRWSAPRARRRWYTARREALGSVAWLPERPLVLLVEDDRDGRLLFAEWLQQAGFRVEQAHNGLQALERAFDLLPDAILTDLNIPGIDGYELTRRLEDTIPAPRGFRSSP